MTIDLQSMKALAQRLAGDVMNQLERDGCANRGNLVETLFAGLVFEEAKKPRVIPYPGYDPVTGLCPACTKRRADIDAATRVAPPEQQIDGQRYAVPFTKPEQEESLAKAQRLQRPVLFAGEPHIFVLPTGELMTRTKLQHRAVHMDLIVPDHGECETRLDAAQRGVK